MPRMVELWCETGQHRWERESQRGRKPRNCPDHRPVSPVVTAPTRPKAASPAQPPADTEVDARRNHKPRFNGDDQALIVNLATTLRFMTEQDRDLAAFYAFALWGEMDIWPSDRFDPAADERELRKTLSKLMRRYEPRAEAYKQTWIEWANSPDIMPGWPADLTMAEAKQKVDPDVRARAIAHVQSMEAAA